MNFRANMMSLRTLSYDYYQGQISFSDYREQRSRLLSLIDEDLNGVKAVSRVECLDEKESFVDKALSFLKN